MDDCTGLEHVPKNKALGRVGSSICTDRSQFEKRHRGKKKASTRQPAKGREGEGAAITHWPRDPEPEDLLDK